MSDRIKMPTGEGRCGAMVYRDPSQTYMAVCGKAVHHADVTSRSQDAGRPLVEYPNVALASLDLTKGTRTVTDSTVTWNGVPATLTEEGAPAFGGFYNAGTELDPIAFAVTTG